uniref:Vitellogenin domain-containing protein n=2 Tax=Timema TaxID=61471 RepID=A0A7R9D2N6_TIMCR|nr:unnamed protein product [Timema cristinae]
MAGAGSGSHLFDLGRGHSYQLESTVLLNEVGGARAGKDVGYQVSATVTVGAVWQTADNADKLLRIEVSTPQLLIKSRKAPAPEGFIAHSSKLEGFANSPYYVHWSKGVIQHVYIVEDEELSLVNFKKGVASFFQFQLLDTQQTEKDPSGKCVVTYTSKDPHNFRKTKTNCVSGKNIPFIFHPDELMGTDVTSTREADYVMSRDLSAIQSVKMHETHDMSVVLRQEIGSRVTALQEITLTDSPVTMLPVVGDTVEAAVKELEVTSGQTLKKQILVTEREPLHCTEECPSLVKLVKENREHLRNENLGITRSAAAFIRLLNAARGAKKEEIMKVLKSSKNKEIISQLYDLAGATQTQEAHDAVMKVLHLDYEYDLDQNERYFWALSLGSHPKLSVIKDVLKLSEKEHPNEKLAETLVLTVSAMTNRFRRQPGNSKHKIVSDVQSSLESGISACKSEECKQKYLRAFKNLALEDTIPTLLKYAINGTKKTSVTAMKAIRALPVAIWNDTVKKAAERIYFQVGRRYDSSSRTLSLDILLESSPSKALLRDLLLSLTSTDPAYEVKQYLVQRLRQIGERDLLLNNTVREIVREEKMLNTYHIQAQRGLTTAFTRSFLNHPSLNGSLVSIQEVSSGLLKRGIVDIVIDRAGQSQEIFSLGLFTGGLGSFLSSDEESSDPDELEESATAGMEVTALGVQVRPFVFFSGQGELMGHVWSGTGSEKTPAFQTIALLQDHLEYLPLQTGFIAELSLIGAVSFDLSGQIQLSLWNKNAHSLVEKNAGIALQGLIKVDTSFVRSQVEFNLATEVKLNLVSDIDFYGNLALCLQLKQPDSVVRHNIYKVERIPGSKHRLRKSKYKTIPVPGRTYALNRKNNEMCNVIHKA